MAQSNPDRLVMVYNAEEGLFNALNDWAHKFFSPSTYECPLCHFTYGLRGMLTPWKTFIENLPYPTVFVYRPNFWKPHPQFRDSALPLILVEKSGRLEILVSAEEIKATGGLMTLVNLVQSRLEDWTQKNDGTALCQG